MKEWNNPQLFSLGVESTFDNQEKCFGDHWCHRLGRDEHLNHDASNNPEGESWVPGGNQYIMHKWTGNDCEDHSNCCCYTTQVQLES